MSFFLSVATQQTFHVGCTTSHLDTEVKQLWIRTLLGGKTTWDLLVLLKLVLIFIAGYCRVDRVKFNPAGGCIMLVAV